MAKLSDLITEDTLTAIVEWKEGVSFTLHYISREKIRQIAKKATEMKFNPSTHAREPQVDPIKYATGWINAGVSGWSGMTLRAASKIAPMKLTGLSDKELDESIPYDSVELVKLVDKAYDLDQFLLGVCTDLNAFVEDKEIVEKNSVSSPSGS